MSAAEKLKALHEAASAYITADDLGQQAVRAANHFVDVMVECAPQIVAVVEAAEGIEYQSHEPWSDEFQAVVAALAALDEALTGAEQNG